MIVNSTFLVELELEINLRKSYKINKLLFEKF